jgi:hypothetical protein
MEFNEPTNYYDVLDIQPNATPSEVREAYYRAKSAYNKDSVALYSLIDPGEREDILNRIEEAYEILSNEDKRRQYDRNHGIIETSGVLDSVSLAKTPFKVVSIDRVPPMEVIDGSESENLFVAPKTDFDYSTPPAAPAHMGSSPPPRPYESAPAASASPRSENSFGSAALATAPVSSSAALLAPERESARKPAPAQDLSREISTETEWRGSFIRYVREAQNISIEEMSNITKVSKTYLLAIEDENFKRLPALVFVRGFLMQVARILRLPQDRVLDSYLSRFKAAKPDN